MKHSIGVIGFTGYSGAEAVRILERHPQLEPVLLEHRVDAAAGLPLVRKPAVRRAPSAPESVAAEGLKAVLLATSPEVSMDLAPKFLNAGAIVVDLSGAFRLRTPERFKRWYKEEHTAPRAARRSGVRVAGVLPGARAERPAHFESRLLSHGGESGHPAARERRDH